MVYLFLFTRFEPMLCLGLQRFCESISAKCVNQATYYLSILVIQAQQESTG